MGFISPVSGNHSIRYQNRWMWITPSGIPRYNLKTSDLVKVNLETGLSWGKLKPSIEWQMHRTIYNVMKNTNAIVHTHSPYTIAVSISADFQHVIEEAKIVVGDPVVIPNKPSGSVELAKVVSQAFLNGATVVIIKNHGVVAVGKDIDAARAIIESLEEWAKILTISKIFGGPKDLL